MPRVDRRTPELAPLGDRAWLASFSREETAYSWAESVRKLAIEDVEVVQSYRTVGVIVSSSTADLVEIESHLRSVKNPRSSTIPVGRTHQIPVLYQGLDLQEVASTLGLRPDELSRLHSLPEYTVYAMGFQAGFPYLGYLEAPLDRITRRPTPRLSVPAGSVAIAARQTGIYPSALPGGWQIIGQTPLTIVDLESAYFPISTGDRVHFHPIDESAFEALRGTRL